MGRTPCNGRKTFRRAFSLHAPTGAAYHCNCPLQFPAVQPAPVRHTSEMQRVFSCAHAVRDSPLIFRPLFSVAAIRPPPSRSPESAALIPPRKRRAFPLKNNVLFIIHGTRHAGN